MNVFAEGFELGSQRRMPGEPGIAGQERSGGLLRFNDERRIGQESGVRLPAGLLGAENTPGPPQFQVLFGQGEAILRPGRDSQALHPLLAALRSGNQETKRSVLPPSDPSAKLMKLGQTETLGLLDDHDRGVGNVHTDLDHRS